MLLRKAATGIAIIGIAAALAGCQYEEPIAVGALTGGSSATETGGSAASPAESEEAASSVDPALAPGAPAPAAPAPAAPAPDAAATTQTGKLIVRSTYGNVPVGGVRVGVDKLDRCYEDGPDPATPLNPVRFTEVVTDINGIAAVTTNPGCYGFALLDHPSGLLPVPHGLHGAKLQPNGTADVVFDFVPGPGFEEPNENTGATGTIEVRSTIGGVPVGGVRVGVHKMDGCYDEGPDPTFQENAPLIAEAYTGPDGVAEVTAPVGCYMFSLIDYPEPLEVVPHGLLGAKVAPNGVAVVEFPFTAGPYYN